MLRLAAIGGRLPTGIAFSGRVESAEYKTPQGGMRAGLPIQPSWDPTARRLLPGGLL